MKWFDKLFKKKKKTTEARTAKASQSSTPPPTPQPKGKPKEKKFVVQKAVAKATLYGKVITHRLAYGTEKYMMVGFQLMGRNGEDAGHLT